MGGNRYGKKLDLFSRNTESRNRENLEDENDLESAQTDLEGKKVIPFLSV